MVKVFISHSTKDFKLVDVLGRYLEACAIKVYIAERDIQPGKPLSQKIEQNIEKSDYFLVVYTENGKSSEYVQQEIGLWKGRRHNINLVPFVEKGLDPGAFLCGLEYIEFDPFNLNLGFVKVKNFIEMKRKKERNQLYLGVGVGIGFIGIISLALYGLSKLDD
ncbi:hypothetical protein LCGC14_1449460 [marine sediment metagenome]|uniref:TIR domain-containing protein n=1 Tax=marine sediment metagenome TaxID=412755 RepID=A0A0F9MK65_9ZZZZ